MTDQELQSLAAATKALFDQRDIAMRSEMATIRASVEAMEAEVRDLRAQVKALPAETHAASMRMIGTLGTKLSAELPAAVASAAATAAEKHLLRAALDRAVPPSGPAS
jgi:predicted  nucleic acid-binding Zn-ribbon protein